jgi:signal transduction histidine kinase
VPFTNKNLTDKEKRRNARFPYWVLATSIFLTVLATYNFYTNALNKDSIRFQNEVGRVQSQIENKISLYTALLKGGRGFVESATELNREKFSKYVESLELDKNYAGVQGIGYTKIVSPDEREELTRLMLAEGYADFKIFPDTDDKTPRQPVIYFAPETEDNMRAVGFDMAAEEVRRATLQQAADGGRSIASAKINLFGENADAAANNTGFLIFLPIYKNGAALGGIAQRRKNLSGYIYGSFRAADFLSEIQKNTMSYNIAIRIFDGEKKPENLLAQTVLGESENSFDGNGGADGNFSSDNELSVEGRRWLLQYSTLPSFAQQSSVGWTLLIFLSGVIFSLLLFAITYWEISARTTLQQTASELFELQGQKQILLEKEQKARLSAERASLAKDEFIAAVSHELRTPLNSIAGWTSILKTENLSTTTKSLALAKIEKNLRAQTKMVEELLDYSQIVSGAIELNGGEIVFSELFENSFAEFAEKAREKNIELTKENTLNGQKISGDGEKLKRVLHNLFSNAVKFTQAGGRISAIVSESDDGCVQMKIADNGEGIREEFLPFVFERFKQADASRTRHFGGLGLGLAVSRRIVEMHKGTIEANSAGSGKGSVFTVKFPVVKKN